MSPLSPQLRRASVVAIGVAGAAAALVLLLVALAHTPPARRAALRQLVATVEERYSLVLAADGLDYSVPGRRVGLSGVTVAAVAARDTPFFAADRIDVELPASVFFGRVSVDALRASNARVTIRRRADGSSNLPEGGDSSAEDPAPIAIDRIDIPRLTIEFSDEAAGAAVTSPALAVDIGRDEGRIVSSGTGRISRGATTTTIERLGGDVTFDGRNVAMRGFTLTTPELTAALDGQLALVVREPALDVRYTASTDLAPLGRWATDTAMPSGRVQAIGTVSGPFANPTVASRMQSESITYDALTASRIMVDLTSDLSRLDVHQAEAQLAGGALQGNGSVLYASGETRFTSSWTGVELDSLMNALSSQRPALRIGSRASGSASIAGAGTALTDWTVDARTTLTASSGTPPTLPLGGAAALRLASGRWMLQATPALGAVPAQVNLGGQIDPEQVGGSTVQGTIALPQTGVEPLRALLRTLAVGPAVADALTAGSVMGRAAVSGTLQRPRFDAAVNGDGIAVADVRDLSAEIMARGGLDEIAIDAQLAQPAGNTATARGTIRPERGLVAMKVTARVQDASPLTTAPVRGVAEVELDVEGPFDAVRATGTARIDDAGYDRVGLGTITAALDLGPARARVDASIPDLAARGRAEIDLAAPRRARVELEATDADVARLVRDLDLPGTFAGRVSLAATGDAPLDDWQRGTADFRITALDATADAVRVTLAQPARVVLSGGTVDILRTEADVSGAHVSMSGRYPLLPEAEPVAAADALRATVTGDLAAILDVARASGLTTEPPVDGKGPVALLATVRGREARPLVEANLEAGPSEIAFGGFPPARNVQLRAQVANGWVDVLAASGSWQGSDLSATARVPVRLLSDFLPPAVIDAVPSAPGDASLEARLTGVSPAVLAPFVDADTLAEIEGALDASLRLEAPALNLNALRGTAQFDRLDLAIAGIPVRQSSPTRIDIAGGVANVTSWNWTGQGAALTVQGQLRLPERTAALLADGRVDLRLLTPFVREAGVSLAGTLAPRLAVSGPLDDPRIDGNLQLADGELRLRDPDVIVTGLQASATLSPERAVITSLTGTINGGTLTGTGDVDYARLEEANATLTTAIRGMGLEFPEGLRSEIEADLTLALAQSAEGPRGNLDGTVTIVRSGYREPLGVVTGLISAMRAQRLAPPVVTPEEPGLAQRLNLNVRVVTDEDLIVDNNVARLELGADLRVIGTAAAPSVAGRATLREGGEIFLGRSRYTIEPGSTIDFADPDTITPDLSVQARTRAGGVEIELSLQGTPDDLEPILSSPTDPLLSQADLASLLITGRRLTEVSGREAEIVGEQVISYLSGDVLGAASRALGIDTIRLGGVEESAVRRDSFAVATEADPTSRVTFGQSIGNSLEVTFSQSLRDGDAQTWIIDYTPLRQVNLRLVSADDDLRSYEFRHDVAIGGPPAAPRPESRTRETVRVAAVELSGDTAGLDDRLRAALDLEPGSTFEFATWQRDRDALETLLRRDGRLEARVSARRDETPDGVRLEYVVSAGPRTVLDVSGYSLDAPVIRSIEEAWTDAVVDDFLREEVSAIVRSAMAADGYLDPRVEVGIVPGETKRLAIAIEPGERTTRRRLVVEAADADLAADVDADIRERRLEALAWSDPGALVRQVEQDLRARGYPAGRAVVEAPRREGNESTIVLRLEPGSAVTIAGVRFEGTSSLDTDALTEAAALRTGDPFDPAAVEEARRRVLTAYRTAGFGNARVTAATENQGPTSVVVVMQVAEGPRQVLRDVEVRGNRGVDPDVIDRALDVDTGAPLGANSWLDARSRLFDTGLFRRVDVTVEPLADAAADDAERPMRLVATVEEWPALRVRYGFQLSEERPAGEVEGRDLTPGLSADITRRTLFGRPVGLGAAVEYHRQQRSARTFVNAPALFGAPIESVLTLERSHESFAAETLVTDRSGVSWEQRFRFRPELQLSYSYRFERDHTFDTTPEDDPIPFDVTINIARLTAAAVLDTRDDPIDPQRGMLVSSNFEYAPEALGSEISFVRHLAQGYYFRPLGGVVLASAGRFGLAAAMGDQELLSSERFFAGGPRTLRGIPEDTLGPSDFFGPAGGRALLLFNQEVRFPVFKWVRGVGFLDIGNIFDTPADIDVSRFAKSIGAGVRVATPFALLRADFAHAWPGTDADPRRVRWTFGIGHTF